MRKTGYTAAGVILVCGAFLLGAAAAAAQEGVSRVKSFEHLDAPRIGLPDGAGEAPMRELCPDVSDMCGRYWAYQPVAKVRDPAWSGGDRFPYTEDPWRWARDRQYDRGRRSG